MFCVVFVTTDSLDAKAACNINLPKRTFRNSKLLQLFEVFNYFC